MRESSAASKREFGNRDSDVEDPCFIGNAEDWASLKENYDDATLAYKLSMQLQQAEERIHQLERERDEFFDKLLAEAKVAIQDAQSQADARLKRTIREGDERVTELQAEAENEIGRLRNELSQAAREAHERVAQLQAQAENEIGRLQNDLSQATSDIDQLKADADDRVKSVKRETDTRVASIENDAKTRIDVIQREHEDKVFRLETELTEATNRANRAEQWVMLVHNEIEHRLMPSVTAMRVGPTSTITAASSGLLAGATVPHSPVRTWFRRSWLQISAAAGLRNRADMELANTFARPRQPEPVLSNGLSLPETDDIGTVTFGHRSS